jgi:hypothetical protein
LLKTAQGLCKTWSSADWERSAIQPVCRAFEIRSAPPQGILAKADSVWGFRESSEIGMQMPIPAVAGIKVLDRIQSWSNKYEQPHT